MITVLANGVWDGLHLGHIAHLQQARKMGDRLVVSVTSDKFVNKGENRPIFKDWHRSTCVSSLRCVDQVIIVDGLLEALKIVRPDILAKGPDYVGKIEDEHLKYCCANGVEISFTEGKKLSSTQFFKDILT